MQKRLLLSLTVISGLVWATVVALLMFPDESKNASAHPGRAEITVENKAPSSYSELVTHFSDIRPNQLRASSKYISSNIGITRDWVKDKGKDKFSIDDLLASIKAEPKTYPQDEE